MLTHYEKNRKAVNLTAEIKAAAKKAGMPALLYVSKDDQYRDRLLITGLASCLADVENAYDAAESDDYSKVIRTKEAQSFVTTLTNMSTLAGLQTSITSHIGQFNVCYHMVHWARHGKHTYKVSDGLAMRLALTELRGLRCEDLRLPFKSLYLEVPEFLGFKIANFMSGWHTVDGIYLSEDVSDSGQQSVTSRDTDGGRSWRVCVMGKEKDTHIAENDDAFVYFTIPLVEGWSLDDALKTVADRVYQSEIEELTENQDSSSLVELDESLKQWLAVFRWTLNVMIYATTPDAEHEFVRDNPEAEAIWRRIQKLPKSKKREDLNARLRSMEQQPRTLLGRSIKVTPALRSMLEHRKTGESGSALIRTLVSGHWRRFAVGEGRKERRWQFVEPYWRGPENAPVSSINDHHLV